MTEVFMKKNISPRSPRVRAHPLKMMKAQTMKVGSSKKSLGKKKIRSQYFYPAPDNYEEEYEGSFVDDPDEVGTYRSMNDGGSIHSNYSMRSMGQLMKVVAFFPPFHRFFNKFCLNRRWLVKIFPSFKPV